MEQTTGKHYMLSALKRQPADRVPTTVLIGPFCSRLTRYSVREILTDARKSAEANLAFHDRFQPDSLIIYNDIYLEAEAVGCELEFPDSTEDRIEHFFKYSRQYGREYMEGINSKLQAPNNKQISNPNDQ